MRLVTPFRRAALALALCLACVGCKGFAYTLSESALQLGAGTRGLIDGRERTTLRTLSLSLYLQDTRPAYDPELHVVFPRRIDVAETMSGRGMLVSYWCRVYLDLDGDGEYTEGEPQTVWEQSWEQGVRTFVPEARAVLVSREAVERHHLFSESTIKLDDGAGFAITDYGWNDWLEPQIVDPARGLIHALTGN